MKYFLDFEATQFSNEIISVGCVREDGQTFYSLVAPVEGKITPFITNLTGITKEMVADALSPDYVFELFYDWVFTEDSDPSFYVWGDCDVDFARGTFKRTKSLKARMALGYLSGSIQDYAKIFCKRAGLKSAKLIKVYSCFFDETEQTHNSLEDAMFLFNVYNKVGSVSVSELKNIVTQNYPNAIMAPAEEKVYIPWNKRNYPSGTIVFIDKHKEPMMVFDNLEVATNWVYNNKISEKTRPNTKLETVRKNIKKACCGGQKYFSLNWKIVD